MQRKNYLTLAALLPYFILTFFLTPTSAFAAMIRESKAVFVDSDEQKPFDPWNVRGAIIGSITTSDINRDGKPELLFGSGSGMEPQVTISSLAGKQLFRFSVFDKKMRQGVNIAVGDVDGDSIPDIIAAPRFGGSPTVRLFTNVGKPKLRSGSVTLVRQEFSPFDAKGTSGLSLAACDVDGDGKSEIVTTEGPNGSPEVRIVRANGDLVRSFEPFDGARNGHGMNVACADLYGTGRANIIIGEASKGSHIEVLSLADLAHPRLSFDAFDDAFSGGVHVAVGGTTEAPMILVSSAGSGAPIVKTYRPDGTYLQKRVAFEGTYTGGVLATSYVKEGGTAQTVVAPTMPLYLSGKAKEKLAEIDLKTQRFYAWQDDYLERTMLISSGLAKTPTPPGDYHVLKKPLLVDYTRVYGPNDPRNYDFPKTRWNLLFRPHYYIHTAWWHNNFGKPMSHGCVNTLAEDAEWIYNWAPIGTEVKIVADLDQTVKVANVTK